MRTRLERGAASLEIEVSGRHIFITEGETSTTQGCFDEDAAREAAAALIAARLADGWREDAATVAARERKLAAERAWAEQGARHAALAAAPDPAAALRELARPIFAVSPRAEQLFEQVLARVRGVGDASAGGFRIDLGDGASAYWAVAGADAGAGATGGEPAALAAVSRHLKMLWLYLEAGSEDANLVFGEDAGPPEGDAELAGTPFEDAEVRWFMQELPWDRYWFWSEDGARCYELDGGLHEELHREPVAELLAARLVDLLSR